MAEEEGEEAVVGVCEQEGQLVSYDADLFVAGVGIQP